MGVTVEQSSDTNISGSIKPPHPSHMHHPYWLQHRFTAHDDTTLSEVYSNLVASSMRQMMAWTPLGWLGGAARHVPTLDETVHMSAELLMHSTEFTARRAGLAYGHSTAFWRWKMWKTCRHIVRACALPSSRLQRWPAFIRPCRASPIRGLKILQIQFSKMRLLSQSPFVTMLKFRPRRADHMKPI